MSAAMDRYVEVVKQYPGQQQVDLAVEIEVPGSWFGVGPMGALTDAERREKYTAQAVEYAEVREFSRGFQSRVSRTLSRTGLLQRRRCRRMERRIKREDTRRTITVLFVTLNKKTHTVSALELHCALRVHSSLSAQPILSTHMHSALSAADLTRTCTQCHRLVRH